MSSLVDPFEELHGKIGVVARSHSELRDRFDQLEVLVKAHDATLADMARTQKMIGELLEIFISVKGGLQFLGWIAMALKWFAPFVALGVSVWVFMKTGKWISA